MPFLALLADEVHKFASSLLASPEGSQKSTGDNQRVLFLDTPHSHTEMFSLKDYGYPQGISPIHDRRGNLVGKPLLDLESAGIDINQTGEFRDADNFMVGDVRHMGLAEEG